MKTGKSEGKKQKHYAQRHSKVSEWTAVRLVMLARGCPKCADVVSKTGKVQELQKWRQLTKILTGESIERGMRKI